MATLYRTITGQSSRSRKSMDEASSSRTGLQRTTTTDPLSGSLNHLTADQLAKLDTFKEQLEKDNWWTPNGVNGRPSHDDGTLLRYLRARKFDVAGAIGQFTDTEKWMKEQKVEELYEHFDVEFYEKARVMYPQWTGRRDKRGIPIYVYEIKGLDSKNVSKYQKESQTYKNSLPNHKGLSTPAKLLPLFALYHNLLNFVLPMCSTLERPNPEIPVTTSTNIVDISGVGLTQFWNLKQHMQDASVLATAHYPETLDRIFIIGAPSFFPTVWSWIKRWFDPVTVSKIFILSKSEVKSTLESFMDNKNIPRKYGGQLDWAWGDLPSMGDAEKQALDPEGKGWTSGPCLFLDHKKVAVGSTNGKLRRSDEDVAALKPILYAADYTEEPVHPDRKVSSASKKGSKLDEAHTNGAAVMPTVSAAPVAVVAGAPVVEAEAEPQPNVPKAEAISHLNVHNSPSGDSQVHLPDHQPAPPSVTAEYISPTIQPQDKQEEFAYREPPAPTTDHQTPGPDMDQALHSNPVAPHPPGITQPGPLPQHTIELNRQIAQKLEGESVSIIPADANGALPHPEITVASDGSKGLALETEKLTLNGTASEPHRPAAPERFMTAAEF